ncbi:phage-related baseplate assembly protein [Chromobacterium alkanivorans]|uniref:baseplate assembly protein n=1 Tax=Chromobacterium alkanivorans TaxID=1071719 RepID=UPI002168E0DC|nr:baseplate J/gp47 family protein [Chromobacterium alkanivorans]MCS3806686.1 phage-related baseplate assembly protein [Chromobacterium alkanivorans]MCS3821142.1 phage-related baseplate assembly protein [Chromobacterium alkanivorans]MCS3875946.1 phage-related baseplate assembly protein [Chromobacterium alkanivorans]
MSLPEPNFIDRNPDAITAEIVAQYEQLSGKTLYPAQVERLLIDVIAYRENLVRIGIQEAAKQNLVAYARAPMLDYLGELVGVTRLPAQPAKTVLRFTVETVLATGLLIPAGTRVEGGDGMVVFATDVDVTLPAGQLSVDVAATCEEPGTAGNGWQPGQINSLVDELGDMEVAAANISVTNTGYDEEDDERLRERIKLAPESFTNAGSRLAYRFHALKAHQSIVDVAVLSPSPGVVHLYPLTATGLPDSNLLALVEATCSAEKVRPLTDRVRALAPSRVDYAIEAQLVLYTQADSRSVQAMATAQAKAYVDGRAGGLGRDIVPSQVIAALQVPGVYQVTLNSPAMHVLSESEWAHCTQISITPAGVANG